MIHRHKSTPEDDRAIVDVSADPAERASALTRLAFDAAYELEPQIASLLDEADPMVRGEAMSVLLGWWRRGEYFERAVDMLHHDPDEWPRGDAAFALTEFVARMPHEEPAAPEVRERVIRELVRRLVEDDSDTVQAKCYEGVLIAIGPEDRWGIQLPDVFDRERDVDWKRLAPYLDADQIPPGRLDRPRVSTEEDVELLTDRTANPGDRVAALDRLMADGRYEVERQVVGLLDDASPLLRASALAHLVDTWMQAWRGPAVLEMLATDPSPQARAVAAGATVSLAEQHWDPEILLRALAQVATRDGDEHVRQASYRAMVAIAFPDRSPAEPQDLDQGLEMDQVFVRRYLGEGG